MTIKTTVTLSESTLREAEELLAKGEYASLSELLEEGARQLILQRQDAEDPVAGMADEIRRRMEAAARSVDIDEGRRPLRSGSRTH